jgi:hypothetical protein
MKEERSVDRYANPISSQALDKVDGADWEEL